MFKIGEHVRWTSSNTPKEGVVVAVVPARTMPGDLGFTKVGVDASSRDHESYVVKGGVPGKSSTLFWPVVSLLSAAEGLTADELAWCHRNVRRVRELIASDA